MAHAAKISTSQSFIESLLTSGLEKLVTQVHG